ncbi:RNA polymerase sigma-70 factor [Pedobacter panaciterrae]|uniref:RNA polymerase sigma factor n=1 Tax=Pedobacter panaciterrae TaxID=363849 RepID=UPI00155DCAE4|nr:RNA polymerase sigma-70 factor [Pedobacter panaciterrae]NQX54435.1 RNA polymerase sigma-70 factor [Pedobacter panaciterrae]
MVYKSLPDERELLAEIAEGNQLAFKKVYDAYFSRTYGFAYYVLHSKELAEEVVQEVMLKLWQSGEQATEIYNLEGYLKSLAKRRAIDVLRRMQLERRAEKKLQPSWKEAHEETEEGILLNETRQILEEGIRLLPQQQRMVYQLCQQEGLKYDQAAERLDIAPGTVHTHMKHALKFLRQYMLDHTDVAVLMIIFKLL